MMPRPSAVIASFIFALAARGADPAPHPATQPDLASQLPQIRQQLASEDFQQREAAQKQLDKIPPSQIDILRAASKIETDPEVKQRLDQRIDAMELYVLLNPPPLTLKLTNATLADVADELNKALGTAYIQAPSRAGSITLDLHDAPFGEVMAQIHRQQPVTISQLQTITAAGITTAIRLTPAPAVQPSAVSGAGSFAFIVQTSGQPATGTWVMRTMVVCDPRIRITQYSSVPAIEKLTDQNGANIAAGILSTASIGTLARPVSVFSTMMSLSPIPGVTSISQMRGTISVAVLQSERKIAIDLNHLPEKPIETARGPLTFESVNGSVVLTLGDQSAAPIPAAVGAPRPMLTITARNADGTASASSTTSATSINLSTMIRALGANPTVEISFVESAREYTLPIDIKDIPLPAPAAIAPARGRGAVNLPLLPRLP
jgi:hypothetical protein